MQRLMINERCGYRVGFYHLSYQIQNFQLFALLRFAYEPIFNNVSPTHVDVKMIRKSKGIVFYTIFNVSRNFPVTS